MPGKSLTCQPELLVEFACGLRQGDVARNGRHLAWRSGDEEVRRHGGVPPALSWRRGACRIRTCPLGSSRAAARAAGPARPPILPGSSPGSRVSRSLGCVRACT